MITARGIRPFKILLNLPKIVTRIFSASYKNSLLNSKKKSYLTKVIFDKQDGGQNGFRDNENILNFKNFSTKTTILLIHVILVDNAPMVSDDRYMYALKSNKKRYGRQQIAYNSHKH